MRDKQRCPYALRHRRQHLIDGLVVQIDFEFAELFFLFDELFFEFDDLGFLVTGHGGARIGEERAAAIAGYLASQGIDSGRIAISGAGTGDKKADVLPRSN